MTGQPSALIVGSTNLAAAAARAVRARNHDVHTATNALHALAVIAREPMQLVVCEPDLPGRNAEWLAREIRRYKPDVPVVTLPPHAVGNIDAMIENVLPEPARPEARAADRRRAERRAPDADGVTMIRLRPGVDARVVDRSHAGLRVRAACRLLPGLVTEFQQRGSDVRIRGRIAWCKVVRVDAEMVTYEAGVALLTPHTSSDR